ncbi:gp53-like domain-containing protein [Veillonella magna]|uniref:gp53-like domain-containing protein n=1 Tax=Veillonella magna TaxID=464322 RepID=UPI003C6F45C7
MKFPVAFNSRCLSVVAFDKSDMGDTINWTYGTGSYTTTDFFCLVERIDGTYPDDCGCQYLALGV